MRRVLIGVAVFIASSGLCFAQPPAKGGDGKPGGQPPALVEVDEITSGKVEPMTGYVGTVFYSRVSEVASEVEGRVRRSSLEEGQRVKKGRVLVRLSTDLINTSIKANRAAYEQARAELERARKDLKRIKPLYEKESISEVVYDEHYFGVLAQEQRVAALKADLERLELEKTKKTIRAPFDGIVVEKSVEQGEWVSEGGKVAVLADDGEVDAIVDVPEEVLNYLEKGREIEVRSGGKNLKGRFLSFIPRGDVATRTFSVKVRLRNTAGLIEGMAARAMLPSGEGSTGLLVSRDAVIRKSGRDVVFVMEDGKAKEVPVRVTGFSGMMAGIEGTGLREGVKVVVKGNERIRDGQLLKVTGK
jgi:RND family efflux transporter MFP subunit